MSSINPTDPIDALRDHIYRNYERSDGVQEWQKLPEIPSATEILVPFSQSLTFAYGDEGNKDNLKGKHQRNLPHNIIDRPWDSVGNYIGAHYQLLREDAIAPLRQAVSIYKSKPTMKDNHDLSIYTHVYIVGMTFSNLGPAPRIEFSYERAGKRIRWQQSKRLQQGTIVALTPVHDKFKSICKVAIVAARPLQGVELNPPQIDLLWGDLKEADFDPLQEYVMVEAKSGYFEASRHMLVALQKLMTESFPLSDHLVFLEKTIEDSKFGEELQITSLSSLRPTKRHEDTAYDIDRFLLEDDSIENFEIHGPWTKLKDTSLDESQLTALRRILTKKLAIVQGPPGTGKTFLSCSALSIMLDNMQPNDPPIIVAAQTNHALDQLLKLIASVEPNFLRLGGRTSEDNLIIKERTLYEVRRKSQIIGGAFWRNYKNARGGLETSSLQIRMDIQRALLQGDDEAKTLLEWNVITQAQFDSLYDDDWVTAQDPGLPPGGIAMWLGREQLAKPPRCPPINMDFGDEEDLEFEALEEAELEARRKDDDDIDMLGGEWFPFPEHYTGVCSPGYSDKKLQKLLDSKSSLWEVSPMIRGEVYRYLQRQLKAKILKTFQNHVTEYEKNTRHMKVARWEADAALIKKSGVKLIGCTTTGLSKYRGLLASLHPRIMLIEEAAETLEGTILAAMFSSLQQLILVGDHQQLRAHCNVTTLDGAPYNLAVSMFERLVKNGIEYSMLNKQRRMISEIRELLDPFYPNLQDHSSVLDRVRNRKPIPGMGGRDTYFFHHQWPESRDDFLSRFNVREADMIAAFFTYIVLNGIDPSQITVLTFYNGQKNVILKKLRKQPELLRYESKFNVFTVDSYQGEENDVILLSLVRSNAHHNIGFLDNKNRTVVSLSRARRGMYIFGNSINLLAANATSFRLWSTITNRLRQQKRLDINSGLPIVCQKHHTKTEIREPGEWKQLAGGCRAKCSGQLPCGHSCIYNCHPFSHEEILCKEPCRTVLPCGHSCIEKCGDPCRCTCHTISPLDLNTGPLKDVLWQPSLDDVLGDSQTENCQANQKTLSDLPNTSYNSDANSAESSPRKWREWDAVQADKALSEFQAASQLSTATTGEKCPVFVDNHLEVAIKNGVRVKIVKSGSAKDNCSAATDYPPAQLQPVGTIKSSARLSDNDKSAMSQPSQVASPFIYGDPIFATETLPSRSKSPSPSPRQSNSVDLSTIIPLSRSTDQIVSASSTLDPDQHLVGAIDGSPFSKDQSSKENPLDSIFPELSVQNSMDDEEDLISFE